MPPPFATRNDDMDGEAGGIGKLQLQQLEQSRMQSAVSLAMQGRHGVSPWYLGWYQMLQLAAFFAAEVVEP